MCGGLRVWWLWVCSGPILTVGLWLLWFVDFVVMVDGILYCSHLQFLFSRAVEVGRRGERKRDMRGYFLKKI